MSREEGRIEDSEQALPDFELNDTFVAPWGLANEERPCHYIWDGEIEFLRLTLAEDLKVKTLFNTAQEAESYITDRSEEGENGLTVLEIPQKEFISPGYLSVIITVPEILDEPIVGSIVQAEFVSDEREETERNLTFTVRPVIHVLRLPRKLRLKDEEVILIYDEDEEEVERMGYPGIIKADLEQIGFSLAQVEVEAWGEGQILSREESVYRDLAQSLVEEATGDGTELFELPEEAREDVPVEISDDAIEETITEFREWLSSESIIDGLSDEEIEEVTALLEAEGTKFDMGAIYKHFEYLLLNSILDVVDRHPADNVQMESPQTKIEIESRMDSFFIEFELSDKLENTYPSEPLEIEVEDHRDSGGIAELELETNWSEVELDPSKLNELRQEIKSDL